MRKKVVFFLALEGGFVNLVFAMKIIRGIKMQIKPYYFVSFIPTLVVLVLSILLISPTVLAETMKFCPNEKTSDLKQTLGLEGNERITEGVFLQHILKLGYSFEERGLSAITRKCVGNTERFVRAYMIYAGFDKTREFTRNIVVLINLDGYVEVLEAHYAYKNRFF